jgi:hypothetical protein
MPSGCLYEIELKTSGAYNPKGQKALVGRDSVARRLGADESKERFEAKLEKIAKAKPKAARVTWDH